MCDIPEIAKPTFSGNELPARDYKSVFECSNGCTGHLRGTVDLLLSFF